MHRTYSHILPTAITLAALAWGPQTWAASSLTVMTYNVAALPQVLADVNGQDPTTHIPLIAPLLDSSLYDVVAIQEAFDAGFYNTLTTEFTGSYTFPDKEPPGPAPPLDPQSIGSGLLRLSTTSYSGYFRDPWDDCFGTLGANGSDCDSMKGYSFARHAVNGGVIDIYNWHADAGTDAGSIAARASNVAELVAAIEANSAGNAVIVLGDTNSYYTREDDVIRDLLSTAVGMPGLTDVWVELINGGSVPDFSDSDFPGEEKDKIFYRSGSTVSLTPTGYIDLSALFSHEHSPGVFDDYSDHPPLVASFDVNVIPEPGTALLVGCGLVGMAALGRRRRETRG